MIPGGIAAQAPGVGKRFQATIRTFYNPMSMQGSVKCTVVVIKNADPNAIVKNVPDKKNLTYEALGRR